MCGLFSYVGRPPNRQSVAQAITCLRHRGTLGFGFWWRGVSGKVATYRATDPGVDIALPSELEMENGVLIAHWRYATSGSLDVASVQPLVGKNSNPVLAHNGQFLIPSQTDSSDTEIIFHTFVRHLQELVTDESMEVLFNRLDGAFSLVCYVNGRLLVARDTHGFRPLFVGRYDGGKAVSSETIALEALGCENIIEVPSGHWAVVQPNAATQSKPFGRGKLGFCSFEHIYFHSRNGILGGLPVSAWRSRLGRELGLEKPVSADLVAPVPHSGWDAGEGYAETVGVPLISAIRRTPEAERTFIADSASREQKLAVKFNIDGAKVRDRRICVVDDSLVRGSTLKFLSKRLREAGAVAIHARIAAPKFRYPCFFGIDVPTQSELAANQFLSSDIASKLGLDSLEFLSVSGLHKALKYSPLCTGCFTSRYPISAKKIRQKTDKGKTVEA